MDISGADVFFDVRFVTLLVILRGVVIGSPLLICPCLVPRRTISINCVMPLSRGAKMQRTSKTHQRTFNRAKMHD